MRLRNHCKTVKMVLIGMASLTMVCLISGLLFVAACVATAPDAGTIDPVPQGYRTTVLDRDGEVILTLAGAEANRIYVTLEQMPDHLKTAFIAIEDERYYSHSGIDLRGIGRSFVKGITSGHFSQGASTITQQLIKNNVLTGWTEEEDFSEKLERKVKEWYLATSLEKYRSKDWILENYLNTINLGSGAWGVEAAARRYYGKNCSELTLAESAVLAGITKAPTYYNPIQNPTNAKKRQELVLDSMERLGYITEEEKSLALAEDAVAKAGKTDTEGINGTFSWFEDALLNSLVEDLQEKGFSEEAAWNLLYSGGLTIHSTQKTSIQESLEKAAEAEGEVNQLYPDAETQISMVVTDVNTGQVCGIIGGRGVKTTSLAYNRATDSLRQPGSTVKVIGTYAQALEQNAINLGTVLEDEPTSYANGTLVHNASGEYQGKITVRRAIASSTNTVAVKLFNHMGISNVYNRLENFGIHTLDDEDKVEALALGGTHGGVTNLELTGAYNAIANEGFYIRPHFYTEVYDREGCLLLANHCKEEGYQAVSVNTAALLTSAMEEVLATGTGQAASFQGMPQAGKSGTSSGNRDLWFVGFTPYYTCGIWGGYDSNENQNSANYVKKLWKQVMSDIHSDYLYKDFAYKDSANLMQVTICSKCGKLAVAGLCTDTVQGDMTVTEYYTRGSAPMEMCDCHVRVTICRESGEPAGSYCPSDTRETLVYLKSAQQGTRDADYVLPSRLGETGDKCSEHTGFMDWIWHGFGYTWW